MMMMVMMMMMTTTMMMTMTTTTTTTGREDIQLNMASKATVGAWYKYAVPSWSQNLKLGYGNQTPYSETIKVLW
jgi:hypothetical protein